MKPHAFVAMPFGQKEDSKGNIIDFNSIYDTFIKPAVKAAGFDVFRADEEHRAGEIRKDMFMELLISDLVVVDLTIENSNVWYELGVRQALRARGVVLIYGSGAKKAFDVYTDRKLRYSIKDGQVDTDTLKQDIINLTTVIKETTSSWSGRKSSPVFDLLPNLQEPDWKSQRLGNINEYWEKYDNLLDKIKLARKSDKIGNMLILAEEIPVSAFRADTRIEIGYQLTQLEKFDFALEQIERGLEYEPKHKRGLRLKGLCLQRLALEKKDGYSFSLTRQHYRNVFEIYPKDSEILALYGRVYKDEWVESWKNEKIPKEQWRDEAKYESALLSASIHEYLKGYKYDITHYFSGINALSLMVLHDDLTGTDKYKYRINKIASTVKLAAKSEYKFWSLITLGDWEVLFGTPQSVENAYKRALTKSGRDWLKINSCLTQLKMYEDLGFNPDNVTIAIETLERKMKKYHIEKEENAFQPRKVFLFSGHMVDTKDRKEPRFPEKKSKIAGEKILKALKDLGATNEDMALTQGACGGDILFTEACQSLGVKVMWLQPFEEPTFLEKSVKPCEGWKERYDVCKETIKIRSAPKELGEIPKDIESINPYERCNRWLLYTALSYGIEKVNFVTLWDGKGGDGPGGTGHMYKEVKHKTGNVTWIKVDEL